MQNSISSSAACPQLTVPARAFIWRSFPSSGILHCSTSGTSCSLSMRIILTPYQLEGAPSRWACIPYHLEGALSRWACTPYQLEGALSRWACTPYQLESALWRIIPPRNTELRGGVAEICTPSSTPYLNSERQCVARSIKALIEGQTQPATLRRYSGGQWTYFCEF